MGLTPLRLTRGKGLLTVTLDRPERQNVLNRAMIEGLHAALDTAEADPALRLFVLEGSGGVFCSGMDFAEATETEIGSLAQIEAVVERLYALFERFTRSSRLVVAVIDGRVTAGGIGLVAASDLAFATPGSSFQLSEILFGLVPATVAPFLVRRTGFQDACRMSLTAEKIDAAKAAEIRLIDTVGDDPGDLVRRLLIRTDKVAPAEIQAMKAFYRGLSPIAETAKAHAIGTAVARLADPRTMAGISRFLGEGGLPWRKPSN
jgi:polyketide biosynthesis enoyl-CoA hydratase PksH